MSPSCRNRPVYKAYAVEKIQSKMIRTVAAVMIGICASVYILRLCIGQNNDVLKNEHGMNINFQHNDSLSTIKIRQQLKNRLLTVGSPLKTASPTKSVKYKQ
uniref:Uncharacterized protein n=1 Tax=Glossina pallidipes TaxID=7398 RepID=A0A1B0ADB5_GLOPL